MPDPIEWPAGPWVTDTADTLLGGSTAVFSSDRRYRYALTRSWGSGPWACWLMLNPSTADALANDPTISRCVSRTHRWGDYGGLVVVNLFALRATDPAEVYQAHKRHADPIGTGNNLFIQTAVEASSLVVAAWGVHGTLAHRGCEVLDMLVGRQLFCLGATAKGQPRHPLMILNETPLQPYPWPREAA